MAETRSITTKGIEPMSYEFTREIQAGCERCGKPVLPSARFCDRKCQEHFARTTRRTATRAALICSECSKTFRGTTRSNETLCPDCRSGVTNFICVDGEGIRGKCETANCPCLLCSGEAECGCGHSEYEHRHIYVLLGCGNEYISVDPLTRPDGLQWHEVFEFLYSQYRKHPRSAFVGFVLGYDFTQWLKSLPSDKAWLLLHKEGIKKRTPKQPDRRKWPVRYRGWEFDMIPDKMLQIRPVICDCPRSVHLTSKGCKSASWMYVCDAGPFFQTSFLKVIDPGEWQEPICTSEEFTIIKTGKDRRSTAGFDDEMIRYNTLENEIFARVMRQLNAGFQKIDINLPRDKWFGPGAAIAQWLTHEKIPTREQIEDCVPFAADSAAMRSYIGGWFEWFIHGRIPGMAYEFDISSAYPSIIAKLPCLLHGAWENESTLRMYPLKPSQIALVYARVKGSDPHIGAMLHREIDGGISVSRPYQTEGWYWQAELEAARRAGIIDKIECTERWIYTPCACPPPVTKIADLYEMRLAVGKDSILGKAAKLIYNSAYGKFVQSVGKMPFYNVIWGSLITSGCRTMILDAIATHPEKTKAAIGVATDAVFFTSPHPGLLCCANPCEACRNEKHCKRANRGCRCKELGYWERKPRADLTVMKPGVYWDERDREAIKNKGRAIFKARGINVAKFCAQVPEVERQFGLMLDRLRRGESYVIETDYGFRREPKIGDRMGWPVVEYEADFAMVTARQAIVRDQWSKAGKIEKARHVDSSYPGGIKNGKPEGKRCRPYYDPAISAIRSYPHDRMTHIKSAFYMTDLSVEVLRDIAEIEGLDYEWQTIFDGYVSPDGPVDMIAYGMAGGQWS